MSNWGADGRSNSNCPQKNFMKMIKKHHLYIIISNLTSYTVKSYLNESKEKLLFEILRVKYLISMCLGPPDNFDISMVFEISVFDILNFNCIYIYLSGHAQLSHNLQAVKH
jgi:hypothetical protein